MTDHVEVASGYGGSRVCFGVEILTTIPKGRNWRMLPSGDLVITHPEHPPRMFSVATRKRRDL